MKVKRILSGAMDHFKNGLVSDLKYTSVFVGKAAREGGPSSRVPEWEAQENIYAWLLRQHGFDVEAVEVCAIYRDWRPGENKQQEDYPRRAETFPLKLWTVQEQEKYIRERLRLLITAEDTLDDDLPECTPEEMWERPTVYAVMKFGAKRSTKNFEDQDDATLFAQQQSAKPNGKKMEKYTVEVRPGVRVRCADYCSVNKWCSQYQAYIA